MKPNKFQAKGVTTSWTTLPVRMPQGAGAIKLNAPEMTHVISKHNTLARPNPMIL